MILQALRWSTDRRHLKAWQRGTTGYPLVDAAMRQLWLTGWMNNYMRHVVASFLIAYLHLPWQEGYRWFQVRRAVSGDVKQPQDERPRSQTPPPPPVFRTPWWMQMWP